VQSRTANTTLAFIQSHIGASDAVQMGKLIEQMLDSEAWVQLKEFTRRMEEDTLRALELGPQEHSVYLYNHGLIRGLRATAEIADGIIEAGKRADADLAAMNAARQDDDGRPD